MATATLPAVAATQTPTTPMATATATSTVTVAATVTPTATSTRILLMATQTPTAEPTAVEGPVPEPSGRIVYVSEAGGAANLWMVEADCPLAEAGCAPVRVTGAEDGIILAMPHPSSPTRLAYLGPAPLVELPVGLFRHIDQPALYEACLEEAGACRRVLLTPEEAAFYVLAFPGDEYEDDLWRVDIATGDAMPLYIEPGPPTLHDAYWIRDGSLITEFDGFNRVVVQQQDPEPHTPTQAIACAGYPAPGFVANGEHPWLSWSADGTRVAAACRLTRDTEGGPAHVIGAVLNVYDMAEGAPLIELPEPLPMTYLDMAPIWMPDGVTVVFTRAEIAWEGEGEAPEPDSLVTLGPRQLWYVNTDIGEGGALIANVEGERNYEALGWVGERLLVRETPYTEETLPADDVWAWDAVLRRDEDAVFWLLDPATLALALAEAQTPYLPGPPISVRQEAPSPDGYWTAAARDGALWLDGPAGEAYLLAEDGFQPVWVP